MNAPIPFPSPAGVPIIGQPLTLVKVVLSFTVEARCNCGGAETDLLMHGSDPARCLSCGRTFSAAFNPATGQVAIAMALPEPEKEPS